MEINITWNICRVCLVEEQKKSQMTGAVEPMRHIFNEDKMLPKQIYDCSGIAMKVNDNLPDKICKKCLTMVKQAVNFRNTCRASNTYLHSILHRTKSATALFKQEQPPIENLSEEVISNDFANNDNIGNEIAGSSNVVQQPKTLKRQGIPLDKAISKIRKRSNSLEINSNSDDLIEHLVEDNTSDNIVQEELLSDYSESCINEMFTEKEDNNFDKILEHENEENESQVNAKSKISSHIQDFQTKEITSEGDEFEVFEETVLNDIKENDYDYLNNIKKENISHANKFKRNFDDEDHIDSYDQEDESTELLKFERGSQHEILQDIKDDMDENQTQVSSTVVTKEYDIIEVQDENSRLSTESNTMQTEYIVDEYLIDGDSSDISLHNSAMAVVNLKSSNKTQTQNVKSSVKKASENQVWICDLCGNHFNNRQLLNAHMKIHRQEKKHECELCFKRFITACNLQAHMRIHTGEKPFECQYCGRRFSDRSSNLRHERIHTNEKPFQCKECGKAFSLAATLKKHLKVHTDERSYRCDICAKSFKLSHQLKAHKNSSTHKAVEKLL